MKTQKSVLLIAVAVLMALVSVGCSFSVTTAKIADAIMTDSIDANGMPGNTVTTYPANAEMLYTSAKILNAPDNTKIRIVWVYATNNETFDEISLDSGDISDRYIYSSFEPTALLPEGDYEVRYFVEDRKDPDATVKFRVTAAEEKTAAVDTTGAYLEDVHMTSSIDANGNPVDSIVSVPPTGTWYVSAVLRNTQPDTILHFVWYDTENNVIDTYDLDPQGATDVYINGSMALTTIAPEGDYWVEIYINDATQPAAQVGFTVSALAEGGAVDLGNFTLYSQTEGGFSIEYPSDWYLAEEKSDMAAGFYPMDYYVDGDINSVFVIALKGTGVGYTLDSAMESWVSDTESDQLENYKNISVSNNVVNGNDISAYEYSWSKDGQDLYSIDFLLINGDDLYVITFKSTQKDLDTLYPYLEKMVLSFQVL